MAVGAALACTMALAVTGCGGSKKQDEDEPEGNFRVEIVRQAFPAEQKLARRSTLEIAVKNVDSRAIPIIAVTVKSFDRREKNPNLADPRRPVFVLNSGPGQKEIVLGGAADKPAILDDSEAQGAYVDTWSLGALQPGQTKTFRWDVTAVKAGPYRLSYSVAAGLDGKSKAVLAGGERPTGVFEGLISNTAPKTKIGRDGRTVIPAED
jgi:hypothetical protein